MSAFANTVIPYYPTLSVKFGSVTAAILYRQLVYWFKKMEYKPFYKFLKPCEHGAYKTGESWTEELGMTETEFRTAFQKIGIAYKSKKEFDKTENKFIDNKGEEKYFCSYIDRLERKTYYFMNNDTVKKLELELNYNDFPRNEETSSLEIKKPISRNEESSFVETNNSISNNSRIPEDYQKNTTEEKTYVTSETEKVKEKVQQYRQVIAELIRTGGLNTTVDQVIREAGRNKIELEEVVNRVKAAIKSDAENKTGLLIGSLKNNYEIKAKAEVVETESSFKEKWGKNETMLKLAIAKGRFEGVELQWAKELIGG